MQQGQQDAIQQEFGQLNLGNRYQSLENQHLERLRQMSSTHRGDVIAKTKLLSHETNRRRRALAIKRKIDAQREEKRRQEILLKRRERQREATEKFQRYRKNIKGGASPSSQRSPSPTRGVTSILIPGLEEALKAVRGNNSASKPPSPGLMTYPDRDGVKHTATSRKESQDTLQKAFYNKYGSPPTPPTKDRVQEQAKEIAARADLHNRSLRNLTNSKSLFEQQLEQHQQLLLEQQKTSLREFNAAIRKEIEEDLQVQNVEEEKGVASEETLVRAESLSSLDSLEAHCPDKENSFTDTEPVTCESLMPAVESVPLNRKTPTTCDIPEDGARVQGQGKPVGYAAGGKTDPKGNIRTLTGVPVDSSRSDITVDTVSTIDIRDGTTQHNDGPPPKQFFLPRYDMFTELKSSTPGNGRESTTVAGTVNDWVTQQNNLLSSQAKPTHQTSEETSACDSGTFYVKAWAPSAAVNSTPASPKHPVGAHGHMNGSAAQPHSTQAASRLPTRTRPQSAKPSISNKGVTVGKNTALVSPTHTAGSHASHSPHSAHVSGAPRESPHGSPHSSHVSHVPHASSTSCASSKSPTSHGQRDVTTHLNSTCKTDVKPAHQNKPVVRSQPGIANGGLGFSNGVLTFNEDVNDSEQGSDCGSISSLGSRRKKTITARKEIRSILKKTGTTNKQTSHFKRSNSFSGKPSSGFDARDSLEVIRLHNKSENKEKVKQKKSVRFADEDYSEDDNTEQEETTKPVVHTVPNQKPATVNHKPPRLTSAKVTSSPKANPSSSRRATSAGPVRSSPQGKAKPVVRPQAAAHIITHQSSFSNPVTTANGHQISLVSSGTRAAPPVGRAQTISTRTTANGTLFEPVVQAAGRYPAVTYDDSGLRLDRTPTDDEINWLWDKVRTCLHRDSQTSSRGSETSDNTTRQAVAMSNKLFDGAMLGQHASVTRIASTNLRRYHSAESVNSYAKRNALLQQRQQQLPHSINSHKTGTKVSVPHGPVQSPKLSVHDPQSSGTNNNNNQELSESMAGFLAAEALAEQSVSESFLHSAVDAAQQRQHMINASKPNIRVPTALSIEEQRLMESIDKLNDKLKITENKMQMVGNDVQQQQQPYVHKPPMVTDEFQWKFDSTLGFRGHQPLVTANRRIPDNVASPKYHFRTGSGTVTRAQTQYSYY